MMRRRLYKFFDDRRWAEAFLDGDVLFRSLAYFRDHEDAQVRADHNEGRAILRPEGGLVGFNKTRGTPFTLHRHAFTSTVRQGEIFVFCASRSVTDETWERFKAVAGVEITDVRAFCRRIEAALPKGATFPGRPGHKRIGQRVEYYDVTQSASPRWALPDLIAASKLRDYAWQDEFRLVFSLTDALGFENVAVRLEPDGAPPRPAPAEHHSHLVRTSSLRDICRPYAPARAMEAGSV